MSDHKRPHSFPIELSSLLLFVSQVKDQHCPKHIFLFFLIQMWVTLEEVKQVFAMVLMETN